MGGSQTFWGRRGLATTALLLVVFLGTCCGGAGTKDAGQRAEQNRLKQPVMSASSLPAQSAASSSVSSIKPLPQTEAGTAYEPAVLQSQGPDGDTYLYTVDYLLSYVDVSTYGILDGDYSFYVTLPAGYSFRATIIYSDTEEKCGEIAGVVLLKDQETPGDLQYSEEEPPEYGYPIQKGSYTRDDGINVYYDYWFSNYNGPVYCYAFLVEVQPGYLVAIYFYDEDNFDESMPCFMQVANSIVKA